MAEEVKKKRGRPPNSAKQPQVDINEKQSEVKMASKTTKPVTTEQVNSRLATIFNRAAVSNDPLRYSNFLSAINRIGINSGFLSNPFIQNQRIKTSNTSSSAPTSDQLKKALSKPEEHEETFRHQSMALYYQNYVYGNLLRLYRDIPKYFHYVVPQNIKKADLKQDKFRLLMPF